MLFGLDREFLAYKIYFSLAFTEVAAAQLIKIIHRVINQTYSSRK